MSDTVPLRSSAARVDHALAVIGRVSAQDTASRLGHADVVVVDVRDAADWHEGRIPGAVNAPRGLLEFYMDPASSFHLPIFDPSINRQYLFCCGSGGRAALSALLARDMGFSATSIEGGMSAWRAAELPVESTGAAPLRSAPSQHFAKDSVMQGSLGIVDIDHLMIRSRSLEHAASIYEKFGFFVCPPRRKIEMSAFADGVPGAAGAPKATLNNRHIIFKPHPGRIDVANFLEFMCIEEPLATPPKVMQLMSFLGDSEGPKTVVCLTRDLDASLAEFTRRGFVAPPTIPFETGWDDTERGSFVRIQARPFVPPAGQMPFQMNCYETSTMDNYQYTPWTVHPNTARRLTGFTSVSANLRADVEFMATRIFDIEPEWHDDDLAVIRPRDMEWRFVSPRGFARLFPRCAYSEVRLLPATVGATIVVDSVATLRSILTANGVPFIDDADRICIQPEHACNTLLEFVPAQGGTL